MTVLVSKFKQRPRFAGHSAGNVSLIFAFSAIPLMLAAGAAVDYVRATRAQTELQAAVDGAALAIATSEVTDKSALEQIGQNYFDSNFGDTALKDAKPDIDIDNAVITVSADFDYPTSFMVLAGVSSLRIAGTSEVGTGTDRNAEVAMVLDYSYSMVTSDKYIRMKDAATKMVSSLAASALGGTLKVGLVPFSAMVRTSMPASYVSQTASGSTWTGCTQDRYYPYNREVSTPNGSAAAKWGYYDHTSENSGSYDCSVYGTRSLDIVPLTLDLSTVKNTLAGMFPVGNTNIPLGVEFGWNLLDPDAPYTEGAAYTDETTKKFIVLLTDGVQTSKQWGIGNTRSKANGNANLVKICEGALAKGITIFAIAYDVTDTTVTDLLKQCAPGTYYEASTSGTEIETVFKAITKRIKKSTLRLAR